MSELKPEVGDVWGHRETCCAVKINIMEEAYEDRKQPVFKVLRDDINSETVGWSIQYLPAGTIKKYYTYIGKSKANIKDLFEVE